LNYRHAYHAGNFADLVKHAVLGAVLDRMLREPGPLAVIDTHAGAGLYELDAPAARASGEAQAGIGRLMANPDAPPALDALKAAVRRLNPKGGHRLYPGSPRLIADRMRPTDQLVACELRPDDAAHLRRSMAGAKAEVLAEDGYTVLAARAAPGRRLLALIDPPFERADDYARAAEAARAVLRRSPAAVILIWLPLKDLETFDGFLRRLEAGGAPYALVIEARLRPLDDPMRMNGCALVLINPPAGIEIDASATCAWVVRVCGEPGGADRVWRLAGD
jgi:23S rRNA (adenine2030-N6)-methyltransferase